MDRYGSGGFMVGNSTHGHEIDIENFKFSYSSLKKLLDTPKIFYKEYVLGEKEISTEKYLLEGNLIHYLLLDNEKFDSKYIVASDKLPSPTNIAVVKYVFENSSKGSSLEDNETLILEKLQELDKHQALKDTKDGSGDSKRLKKIIEPKTEEYYNFLQSKGNKEIIDSEMLDKCTRRVNIIKEDLDTLKLLGLGKYKELYQDVKCEYPIDVKKYKGFKFGLKGILDNVTIDLDSHVTINDFKTTSKDLSKFPDTVEFYRYSLQAAVYVELIVAMFKEELNITLNRSDINFNFIVFDRFDQLYTFPVSQETLNSWKREFIDTILPAANWHLESQRYDLPYEFALKNVYL